MNREPISSETIAGFYDDYAQIQQKTGTNLRHYYLFSRLKKAGLKRHHHVLEVGCGIGTLTRLIHRYVKHGKVVAVDISEKSIASARKRFGNASRIEFMVSDMQSFIYPDNFDFIVLPDVLEHIPIEQHQQLFGTLRKHMHQDSIIYINIPHPQMIEYLRKHDPGKLQVIDQEVHADTITRNAYLNDLLLKRYFSYSLFDRENDYVEIIFSVRKGLSSLIPYSRTIVIWRKLLLRIRHRLSIL
ncbi:MAG: class I SAM-dependent methyltransferase [Bacteroidales bacterium]|nr:class I SAM-dependent methyltransferase [Lentimicrobiaceae bacterium]MDD5695272.1 class I SAM-dependent methyltransferase [Bacteroidales bacterium]